MMIRHYDMDSCEPIGDEGTTRSRVIAPSETDYPLPRLMTVAEAVAEESRCRLPDAVVMIDLARFFEK